jgi:L-lactate dehydrogenase complex protein LldG
VQPGQVAWVQTDWDRDRIASLPVGLLPAEFLLADTGTAVVVARSPAERLLCYLPTIAVVVAETHRLVAHMSDIWEQVTRVVADPAMRGEVVFVTGPSRTADIEKKLVLGAHGPKRLVVLLTDTP